MAIITISRGSYSHGKEIAEKVAQRLGYACISRELLHEASEQFHIPEASLKQALEEAPTVFDLLVTHDKERYLELIEAMFLEHAHKDNMVYHGLVGHVFLKGIKHVLKVRVIADVEDRVRLVRETQKISRDEALHYLKKVDSERKRWSLMLYGLDPTDPSLYHLVIHVNQLTLDDAADIILHTAALESFKATPESKKALDDLALAAKTKAKLVAEGTES